MTEDNNVQEELLTAKEAVQIFINAGLSLPTFRRRVNAGLIQRVLPEGRQRGGLYPASQVRSEASKGSGKKKKASPKRKSATPIMSSMFSQAIPEDMVDMAPLLMEFYGSRISVEKRAAWIVRNPQIAFILRSNMEANGCAFVMPLVKDKLMQILSSQVKPPTRPGDIPLYIPGGHVDLYVRAVGVRQQSVSLLQRTHWAVRLILGIAHAVVQLGSQGVYIDAIYAQGDTLQGERLLRLLGFFQIDLDVEKTDETFRRKNYVMDVPRCGSPLAMRYKAALNRWRALNEEE